LVRLRRIQSKASLPWPFRPDFDVLVRIWERDLTVTLDAVDELARQIRAAASNLAERQQRFLADLIRIRSYTGDEAAAVERTLDEMRAVGCDEFWMDSAGNALGRVGSGERVILYDAHLDTNEVADATEWPHPPFEPVVANGAMWGLGASDCKGGVAAIVYGAAILKALGLTSDFTLLVMGATLEEDAEGFALRALIDQDGVRPDVVLLAEATDLSLRRGHRGRCEIRVRTTGKEAHASHPQLGESALLKMLPVIEALENMNAHLPDDAVFGRDTQVVTLIEGPHTPNSVPGWCEVTVDRRMAPSESKEDVLDGIRSVVEPLGARAHIPDQPVLTHTGKRLDGPSFFPGWLLDEEHPLLGAGSATHQALWKTKPLVDVWQFSTDGTYSAGDAGIPTFGYGPQEERFVHSVDDQVDLQKLERAAAFYALFPLVYAATE
jgi:putative selenium metabolism hydrolase